MAMSRERIAETVVGGLVLAFLLGLATAFFGGFGPRVALHLGFPCPQIKIVQARAQRFSGALWSAREGPLEPKRWQELQSAITDFSGPDGDQSTVMLLDRCGLGELGERAKIIDRYRTMPYPLDAGDTGLYRDTMKGAMPALEESLSKSFVSVWWWTVVVAVFLALLCLARLFRRQRSKADPHVDSGGGQ